jgi:type VI secretion system secreted protein VgrG
MRPATYRGPLADVLSLRSLRATERLGAPFEYDLELFASERIELGQLLGQPVWIELELADGRERFWNGIVNKVALAGTAGSYILYRASVRPWLTLLDYTKNHRIFRQKSVPEITKIVFRDHGSTDVVFALTEDYRSRDFVVQYGETDLHFVSRLLEEEGIY